MRRKMPLILAGAATMMLAVACSSSPSTRSGTETISGTVTGQPAAAMMNTSSNVQPVFPVFSFAGVVSTVNRNYTLPGGNSNAKTATDTFVTPAGDLAVTHTRTYQPSDQTPPSLAGQTGNVCHFTLVGEKGTYVTVPAKSTGQFKDATGHGSYLITLNIAATLPAGKTACSISDYGAKGPTAIAAGTSFVFKAAGPLTVQS